MRADWQQQQQDGSPSDDRQYATLYAALEASLAAFDALAAENDRLRASRHHHSK